MAEVMHSSLVRLPKEIIMISPILASDGEGVVDF
jgi:hypothetical protein